MEYALFKDGEMVMIGQYFEMVAYIHTNHSYSFDHALKYEGYEYAEYKNRVDMQTREDLSRF